MLVTINIFPLRKPVYIQYYQVNVHNFLDIINYQLEASTCMFFEDRTPFEKHLLHICLKHKLQEASLVEGIDAQ